MSIMGGGGGGSGQSQSVGAYPTLTTWQRKLLKNLTAQIHPGESVDVYGGEIAPDATASQEAAFDLAGSIGGRSRASRDQATERGVLQLLSGESAFDTDPTARKNLYEAERAEEMRRFQEEVLPTLGRAYGARGHARSGGLEGSMRLAAERLGDDLYRRNTELLYQDENVRRQEAAAARDRIATGVGADAAARQNQALDARTLLEVGGTERAIGAQQNQEAYNKWLAAQPYYNPWLGFLPAALGTQTSTPVVKSDTDWASIGTQLGTSLIGLAGSAGY